MPVVVLEGCDGAGKSTLADAIMAKLERVPIFKGRTHLIHYGAPKYDADSRYTLGEQAMNQLIEPLLGLDPISDFLVLDRFHWGEPVYAPHFRPQLCHEPLFGTLSYAEFYYVEDWLQSVGALTAYCVVNPYTALQRMKSRADADMGGKAIDVDSEETAAFVTGVIERYDNLVQYLTSFNRKSPSAVELVHLQVPDDTSRAAVSLIAKTLHQCVKASEPSMNASQDEATDIWLANLPRLMEPSA